MHSILKSLLLLVSVTLVSCGDDDATSNTPDAGDDSSGVDASTNDDTSEDRSSTSSASSESTTTREGPWGCYLSDVHVCDCAVENEAECEGVGSWVAGCASCIVESEDGGTTDAQVAPDGGDAGDEQPGGPGCYDSTVHVCACDTNEVECVAAGRDWIIECQCPIVPTDASTPTSDGDSGSSPDASESTDDEEPGPGCYDPNAHVCACDTNEIACVAGGGSWEPTCECPLTDAGALDSGALSTSASQTTANESTGSDAAASTQEQDAGNDASADPTDAAP